MKISIVSRENQNKQWGGDLRSFEAIKIGLEQLGHELSIVPSSYELKKCDFVFLANTSFDLRAEKYMLDLLALPYGIIPFHEDHVQYHSASWGFYEFVQNTYNKVKSPVFNYTLDHLFENPSVIHYFTKPSKKTGLVNFDIVSNATVCIANSPTEAKTLQRDYPEAKVKTVLWTPGFADEFTLEPTNEFLDLVGLPSKSYILQVGRLETRKNQLATILASKDIDIPVVFIATKSTCFEYELLCLQSIVKWRKAPTIIVAQEIPSCEEGPLKIVPMPNNQKLSNSMLQSAFYHAGLHLHPAFQELPGYTYFESVLLGIPTIASSWTTIKDYFSNPDMDDRIEYCHPGNLKEIKKIIEKKFGQKYLSPTNHPIFNRSKSEMASEIIELIRK